MCAGEKPSVCTSLLGRSVYALTKWLKGECGPGFKANRKRRANFDAANDFANWFPGFRSSVQWGQVASFNVLDVGARVGENGTGTSFLRGAFATARDDDLPCDLIELRLNERIYE